jgi:hypothetical protein
VSDFDEGDDDDDDYDDDILRCERIFLRIFAFVIHFLPPEKPSSNALLSNHTHDDDTQYVPGVLSSSSRGENGGIIINIIASSFLAGPIRASFSDEKK